MCGSTREGDQALALSTLDGDGSARDASFNSLNVVAGAAVSRHQVFVDYAGEHSKAQHQRRRHAERRASTPTRRSSSIMPCRMATAASCSRPCIDGEATGVFQGKIIVRPHAQKTDGRMMSAARPALARAAR